VRRRFFCFHRAHGARVVSIHPPQGPSPSEGSHAQRSTITRAIGGALAAFFGADFLCYVTPAEHLRLPDERHVVEGVIASRIAAHAADLAKGLARAREREMALARRELTWDRQYELSVNPPYARMLREQSGIGAGEECTMCGEYCAIKRMRG
jgi:phosphomethylpyrimidine synthase